MDITTAIKHILDGNAVIIMGAGASSGATNAFGKFPSGRKLAKDLYSLCGFIPDDKNDLQDAAQMYEDKFSAVDLIQEIRSRLTCASFLPCHSVIYSQPWMRYYTTNYDNVALLAAKEKDVKITPISLSANYKKYCERDRLCIHINGHIDNLNEDTLHTEFKLTADSYLSYENIQNSDWGALLSSDLEAARCIIILGLSLKYDLDLSRIIYNAECKDKTVIISSTTATENSKIKLSRFGNVNAIGVKGFAKEIEIIASTHMPRVSSPIDRIYTCFDHEYCRPMPVAKAMPTDVFNLFLCGAYKNELFHKTKGVYDGFVYRTKFYNVQQAVLTGKKYVFIHAGMGNGKTACIEELKATLSKYKFHVFSLSDINITNLSSEILSICSIDTSCVVIIENYTSYMDVLRLFSIRNHGHIQFVFTARSALNFSRMQDVFELFSIGEGESAIIEIDKLSSADIKRCVNLFDRFGAWGKNSRLSDKEKQKLLRDRDHGNSKFQSIMIDVMQSDDMIKKIKDLIRILQSESKNYHSAIILILITQMMSLRISATDIEKITGQSIQTDAAFRTNSAIQELLTFTNGKKKFVIKSPVTSSLILREIAEPGMIIDSLNSLALYAIKYQHIEKYSNILNDIISFSHIASFLRGYRNMGSFLANYYDKLSEIDYYRTSNFFWLQYAISCIEIADFPRAQKYLDDAYGLVPEDFVPFQINNQQARLYLEMIINNKSKNVLSHYKEAHRLLMLPIVSSKDNEFNVVKLFGHYTRKDFNSRINTNELKEFHKSACKDAHSRIAKYLKNHPEHNQQFYDLQRKLLKCFVSP